MFCPNCGDANPDEAKFCGKCGRPMPAVAAAAAPKPKPTFRTAAAGAAAQLTAPAVSDGLKWGVAIGSVLIPFIGLVMGIIYVNDANPEKKAAAKIWFIAAGIGVLFYVVQCSQSGNY
jgi:uncharacterized membrane protein YvbJ